MNIKFRKIIHSNEGVAGVLVGLLMVGLIISAIAFIQMYYVPQWMKEKESEHLNQVSTQFSQLKFSIDNLAINGVKNKILSLPITLGTKELPFLSSVKSHGNLEVSADEFKIEINYDANKSVPKTIIYNIGSIKYSSENSQFINQVYSYEAGAVILSQDKGEIVRIKPSFLLKNNGDLLFELTRIIPKGGKNVITGFGTHPIQVEFSNSKTLNLEDVSNITIINSHLDAWFNYFNEVFLLYQEPFTISQINDGIEIQFSDESYPSLELKLSDMNVQLSTGWIK